MEKEGTIKRIFKPSWWVGPSFILPKQNGTVRFINDFRELNKMLKRKPYELPRIQHIMNKRKNYTYCTKIDLSMALNFSFQHQTQPMPALTPRTPVPAAAHDTIIDLLFTRNAATIIIAKRSILLKRGKCGL